MSVFGGAGALVRLNDTADATDAYLVTPAAHVGRVATGVVLLSDTPVAAATSSRLDRLGGLAAVAFADKVAEQGYKVLVIDAVTAASDVPSHVMRAAAAASVLKQQHDVQRVALLGNGRGADVALASLATGAFDAVVALSPDGRYVHETSDTTLAPLLLLVGGQTPFASSETLPRLQALYDATTPSEPGPLRFRARVFPQQHKGFAFSTITNEDAATQAIAEILDWLVLHLHRFRAAACTSDTDPWWPQGRNGPFCNVGQKTWQETRNQWLTATVARPPRPPAVPSHLLFDGLSSMRRTFDLPHRMALGDIVELFVEIWEVQQ